MNSQDKFNIPVSGHVVIKDTATGEVLLDQHNDVHQANMTLAIAKALANIGGAQIYKIKFGNQGTYVDSSLTIKFRTPNVVGATADLYNPTYADIVDAADAGVGAGNSVTYSQVPQTTSVRLTVVCNISPSEAVNRPTDGTDASTTTGLDGISATAANATYFFDELGLFTKGAGLNVLHDPGEMLLTHLIFSPIEHTGNRDFTIIYSLVFSVS